MWGETPPIPYGISPIFSRIPVGIPPGILAGSTFPRVMGDGWRVVGGGWRVTGDGWHYCLPEAREYLKIPVSLPKNILLFIIREMYEICIFFVKFHVMKKDNLNKVFTLRLLQPRPPDKILYK